MVYDNLIIYYFSGTGNALKASGWIIEKAESMGIRTFLYSIDQHRKPELPETEGRTLIGFCSPTHGFNLPWIMIRFLLRFPAKGRYDTFLLNTRGGLKLFNWFTPGLSGVSYIVSMLILLLKGHKFRGLQPLDMPSNWVSIHPGLNENTVAQIVERCRKTAVDFAEKVLNGKRVYRGLLALPFDMLIAPVSFGYFISGRFWLAKSFMASSGCNGCRICEEHCPVGAIKIKNDRPFWSYNCESCMRCMNLCPKRSIQTAHLFVTMVIVIFSFLPVSIWLSKKAESMSPGIITDLFKFSEGFFSWAFHVSVLFIIYRIFSWFIRYRTVNKLFIFASFTKYWKRFYKAPGIKASDFKKNR